jgi:hypothetical protein
VSKRAWEFSRYRLDIKCFSVCNSANQLRECHETSPLLPRLRKLCALFLHRRLNPRGVHVDFRLLTAHSVQLLLERRDCLCRAHLRLILFLYQPLQSLILALGVFPVQPLLAALRCEVVHSCLACCEQLLDLLPACTLSLYNLSSGPQFVLSASDVCLHSSQPLLEDVARSLQRLPLRVALLERQHTRF